jgi:hypothetical protein
MNSNIEPVEADLEEVKTKYPAGAIVLAEKEDSSLDWGQFRAVVTGHSLVEHGESYRAKYPGPRVNVSTNAPGYERTDDSVNGASALRPCEILEVVGTAKPVDEN